jgi:Na+-driven multidrug efflux pump
VLPGLGLGIAAPPQGSQALGRKDPADAYRWAWDVYRVAAVLFTVLAAPMLLLPGPILLFFLRDPALVEVGLVPLRLIGLGILVDGLGLVLMHALLGAGATGLVMKVSVAFQWLLFLPLAYVLGPMLGWGLTAVWLGMTLYRALQSGVFVVAWQRREWVHIKL